MMLYLANIAAALASPLGLALFLGLLAGLMWRRGRARAGRLLLCAQLLLVWACSAPAVAGYFVFRWEYRFPAVAIADSPVADAVIVLGGAVGEPVVEGAEESLFAAVDRLLRAARLYKAGKVRTVIVSGGNLPWLARGRPEAAIAKGLLVEWGVPADAVLVEARSRNTYENAVASAALMGERGLDTALLVTSAIHMPRAVATFASAGLEVIPSPADYLTDGVAGLSVLNLLPDVGTLSATSRLVKELVGVAYYRARGWISG